MPALRYDSSMPCSSPARSRAARCSSSRRRLGSSWPTGTGPLREDLPPITTFLNRLLALPIALQNGLFEVFESLLAAKIEGSDRGGHLLRRRRDGRERKACRLSNDATLVHTHARQVERRRSCSRCAAGTVIGPMTLAEALDLAVGPRRARAPARQCPVGSRRRPGAGAELDAR